MTLCVSPDIFDIPMATLSFLETCRLMHADLARRLMLENKPVSLYHTLVTLPKRGFVSVVIYRLKRYLFLKQSLPAKVLLRLLKFPEFHYCHNELDPRAEIGPGLVLGDLGGVALGFTVIIGKNCTFMGKGTPTLGAMEGIDIQQDRIRIGDYCTFGHNAKIINPVTVADCVQIAPNAVVMTHVKVPGAVMSGFPAKTVDTVNIEQVKAWSPLLSRSIHSKM